jgi:hypothetical protein
MSELLANPKICGCCSEPGCTLKCACKLVFYCGTECQGKDWPVHKKVCTVLHAKKVRDTRREHGKDGVETGFARLEAAKALQDQGRFKEAERCYLEARRITRLDQGEGVLLADIDVAVGSMYKVMGRYSESMTMFQEGLRIFSSTVGRRSSFAGRALGSIGDLLLEQGQIGQALAKIQEAHSIFTEKGAKTHADARDLMKVLASKGNCYFDMGRLREAQVNIHNPDPESLGPKCVRHFCAGTCTCPAPTLNPLMYMPIAYSES